MRRQQRGISRLRLIALLGSCAVVAGVIAGLCLSRPRLNEPAPLDTPVPPVHGLSPEEPPPPPSAAIGHRVGDAAPDFSLRSLRGETISLSDYRGRFVILDFWASWCVPCRLSMPSLVALAGELGDKVVLLGVSLDRSEADATSYVAARGYEELVAVYGSQTAAQGVADMYGVLGIPRTFVIDRDGIVRFAGHPTSLTRGFLESLF